MGISDGGQYSCIHQVSGRGQDAALARRGIWEEQAHPPFHVKEGRGWGRKMYGTEKLFCHEMQAKTTLKFKLTPVKRLKFKVCDLKFGYKTILY